MRKLSLGALSGFVLFVAGCGGGGSYANNPRPAAPITVTAAIRPDGVVISPGRIGAGPIVLIATNLTSSSQELVVGQGTSATGDSTGPINPQGVGQLKVDVNPGHYTISASRRSVRPAILAVGKPRPSAQNDLLQP
ncbi:MAG: hypothetical protein JWN32_1563 [Solirubrobacterales bacterium]|nr:hypothetical protein [Solirubrobacterales bacterium]